MSDEPLPPASRRPLVGGSRYGWSVAAAGLLVLVYITIDSIGASPVGSHGLAAGARLPPFAAPLVLSSFPDGAEANVATRTHTSAQAGRVPACDVRSAGAFNVCTASARRPLVLAFFSAASDGCVRVLDTMERVRGAFPNVSFAAISTLGERGKLRALVRSHGWSFPVAYDHDGAVSTLYGVAVCPTLTLAYAGGRVMKTVLGDAVARPAMLNGYVRALLAGPPAR